MIQRLAFVTTTSLAAAAVFLSAWFPQGSTDTRTRALERLSQLERAFTGGPGGSFDWHLPQDARIELDTNSGAILGGPGGAPLVEQTVHDGIVHVRDFHVPEGSRLTVSGNKPLIIIASGDVHIGGSISVDGDNAAHIFTIHTPQIPKLGAAGNAGGGRGGAGSPETTQVSLRGATGEGAFAAQGLGGQGGESGWHPDTWQWGELRRAAGGGGGVFAPDVLAASGCLDQTSIGLDAEDGFPGAVTANAALRPGKVMPWGGRRGRGPFIDADARNDFYGLMIADIGTPDEMLVTGELPHVWAGAGGGGGGDAIYTQSFPPAGFVLNQHNSGAGGGGGAGGLMILTRGDIVFGPLGRLSADGGHGVRGESTSWHNGIGGGSGGGSGGHIILQSLSRIDLSALPAGVPAITARGGQGGAGADNLGGAYEAGPTSPAFDAQHRGILGPGDLSDNPWLPRVPFACWSGAGVVRGAGGDGGPGLIQLHVRHLGAILPPGSDPAAIRGVLVPAPVGYADPGAPLQAFVDLLLPGL